MRPQHVLPNQKTTAFLGHEAQALAPESPTHIPPSLLLDSPNIYRPMVSFAEQDIKACNFTGSLSR